MSVTRIETLKKVSKEHLTMSQAPLMQKSTAVWLVENTTLSFKQIAEFCHLHELEVKGIADGDVASGVRGLDPVSNGQLTREEVAKGEANPEYRMKLLESKVNVQVKKATAGPRYTPVSRRGDRPDAIAWLLRYHPELPDAAVMKLVGTTKHTISAVRDRTHWNATNLKPVDPVSLGICTQLELDLAVQKAAARGRGGRVADVEETRTLLSASEVSGTRAHEAEEALRSPPRPKEEAVNADSVFAKLKGVKIEEKE
jgi:uncharacterized protein